jgi:ABC-2 type transport system ATP-binding protein
LTVGVQFAEVHKRYGAAEVLRGLTFQVRAGEAVALVGPNGAGKTTTLRVAAALTRPSAGSARVCGRDVAADPQAVRRCVGVVLEQAGVYGRLSGVEILRYFGRLCGLPPGEVRRRTDQLVQWLRMVGLCDKPASTYSRGMRQRLHLARALLHDPPVLLLDEPTAGLDEDTAAVVRQALRSLVREGRCVLWATHSPAEARQVCDRVLLLRQGKIWREVSSAQFQGEPALDHPENRGAIFGDPGPGPFQASSKEGSPDEGCVGRGG